MQHADAFVANVAGQAPARCRWCGAALSALARARGDVCDAMDCRRHAADARNAMRRAVALERVSAAAACADDAAALATVPVLWLRQHATDLAPPLARDVAALRAHLQALEGDSSPAPALHGDDPPSPAIAGALCALCRGRCCRGGLGGKAFIEAHQLRAWLARRPDARWDDAVDHWLGFVPPEHLDASCLFHTTTGCALPRERRSEVCNGFACDALEQAGDLAAGAPDVVVLVGAVAPDSAGVETAVLSAQGSRPLRDAAQVP